MTDDDIFVEPQQAKADLELAIQQLKDEQHREHQWRLVTGVFHTAFEITRSK